MRALFYPNEVHSVFGEPESMKSWLLLVTASQEVRREKHVFYVDMEANDRSIVQRLLLLGTPKTKVRKFFRYFRPDGPITSEDQDALARLVKKKRVTLVVLDGVTEALALHGLSPNASEDVAVWFREVCRRYQVEPTEDYAGPAIVELDHVVKDRDARGGWAIGSVHKKAGIKGAAYSIAAVSPFGHGKLGRSRLFLEKDSPGGVEWVAFGKDRRRLVAELNCDATGEGSRVAAWLEAPSHTPTPEHHDAEEVPLAEQYDFRLLMQSVHKFVTDNPSASLRVIRTGVRGTNDRIAAALDQLLHEGYVENQGTQTKSKFVVVCDFSAICVEREG